MQDGRDGEVLAKIPVVSSNVWEEYSVPVELPDGVWAIYLTYRGGGNLHLRSSRLA